MVRQKRVLLITGASGLLGNKIVTIADKDFLAVPTDLSEPLHPTAMRTDITNQSAVAKLFNQNKPDIVIHTASETNVDKCETRKEHAWKVNVEGTRNIAVYSGESNAKLIYISTDYVFDGEKGCYNEDNSPNPLNHYGLTKLEGEKEVMRLCRNYAILRTSVLYGRHPYRQDFVAWVTNSIRNNKEIAVVEDHFNTPTLADSLAEMAIEVAEKDLRGIYHASGSKRISRFKFAKQIAKTFNLDADLVKPIKMKELKAWIAKRPRDSSLDTEKIRKQLKAKPLNITEGLRQLKEEMKT